jgi:hypothetical protein
MTVYETRQQYIDILYKWRLPLVHVDRSARSSRSVGCLCKGKQLDPDHTGRLHDEEEEGEEVGRVQTNGGERGYQQPKKKQQRATKW